MNNQAEALAGMDDRELAVLLWTHAERCEISYMYRRTTWLLCWYYLNGYRRFDVFDPRTGRLSPHVLDADGNMEFQSQELLFNINQVAARVQSMDLRPSVTRQGTTLGQIRNRASAQLLIDSAIQDNHLDATKELYAWTFTCLGSCGITGHLNDHPTIGLITDLEVIHPRELFPFPAVGQDLSKAHGRMRQRIIPVAVLKQIYGPEKFAQSKLDKMEWFEVNASDAYAEKAGLTIEQTMALDGRPVTYQPARGIGSNDQDERRGLIGVVKVREVWTDGPGGTVSYYAMTSGEEVIDRQDTRGLEVYCPIGWSRFMNNGMWHGAGMFDLLFSQHRQLERLQKQLYNNVMDLDRYGLVVLPQGEFNQDQVLREVGSGLKVLFWQPDPMAEHFSPFNITPFNTGDMPGRVAAFAREGLKQVNPIRDLLGEKGRVDSATGLQFLDEQVSRSLAHPTMGVAASWGAMWRSMTQKMVEKITVIPRPIPVTNLTLELAGVSIDPETNEVSFQNNPIPSLSRLGFTVKSLNPRSEVARKAELLNLWEKGLFTEDGILGFKRVCLSEGLDFPLHLEKEKGPFEACVRTILMLYNDGENPGAVTLTPQTTRADLLLEMATSFMQGPYMQVASVDVIDAFTSLQETVMGWMKPVLPPGTPNMDDMAALSSALGHPPMMDGGPTHAGALPAPRLAS